MRTIAMLGSYEERAEDPPQIPPHRPSTFPQRRGGERDADGSEGRRTGGYIERDPGWFAGLVGWWGLRGSWGWVCFFEHFGLPEPLLSDTFNTVI